MIPAFSLEVFACSIKAGSAARNQNVDVFDAVDKTIAAEQVRMALHDLTHRQRQAVELAYLDG